MKVAISTFLNNLDGKVNPIFGRCSWYAIVEIKEKEIKNTSFIENTANNSSSGAGVAASQLILNQKVDAVISGNLGPNAFMILSQSGIKCYQTDNLTIKKSLDKLSNGTLHEINNPSTQSKFGLGRGARARNKKN
jgi:predicted Fe-Mo cluster-binding NifX family protein